MKKILVVSNNESIIDLFAEYVEYSALQRSKMEMEIVNERPPKPFITTMEAVEKIRNTDFDVLVIGHKLGVLNFELLYCGLEKPEDGAGLETLELAKYLLKNKIVISDGSTPINYPQVMNSYRKLGVKHFINRGVNFTDRFNNLMLCLGNKCDCDKL